MKIGPAIDDAAASKLALPPLPLFGPTALTGDGGNEKAYLRWNLQLEDERVVGWKVLQLEPPARTASDLATANSQPATGNSQPTTRSLQPATPQPQARTVSPQVLTDPAMVVTGLANGTEYEFAVVGVLADGTVTPQSNSVTITPHDTGVAKVVPVKTQAPTTRGATPTTQIGQVKDVPVQSDQSARVVFPDGQELVFSRCRPIDWKTRDGEHMIYPQVFGNGLDVGRFDSRGLPVVIPPDGLKDPLAPVSVDCGDNPGDIINRDYEDVQFGCKHPFITDPMTLSLASKIHGDASVRWFPPQIDGDRVTFHYWQPLVMWGYKSWQYVMVWETWWPIERDRHGCKYHGLARMVEVQMPEAYKAGYQVMLNNGFGPGAGSRQGVVSYSSGFRRPGTEVIDFSDDTNRQVSFQHPKSPRRGAQYHPNQDCLQASPLLFYDWEKGSLTIAARSEYYHCANASCSYVQNGADGVWPNLAWDMTISGRRTAMDTVEYLYTSDMTQPLPQRYNNARFEAYGDVSRRMGVQNSLVCAAVDGSLGNVPRNGGPAAHADKQLAEFKGKGIDGVFIFHDFWHAVPVTVDDAYRLDPNHDCNPQLAEMCRKFHEANTHVGFWFRPEVVKTSIASALSKTMPTAEVYYGYSYCKYPVVVDLLHERGIPIFRQNTNWTRRKIDGSWPSNTPYQWIPMSLATDWWNRIMWPTLQMSRRLGFDFVLMDGGFGGMQGVDYAPMLNGKRDDALPFQPFWWRMFRTMKYLGIKNYGECTLGWKGGNVTLTGPGDEHYIWMYQNSTLWGNNDLVAPRQVHQLFQLYNSTASKFKDPNALAVVRYASEFYRKNRPPDWVEFKDLRQQPPVEVTVKVTESPVAGGPTKVTENDMLKFTVSPWTWGDMVWHYDDGTEVVYPAFDKIDWTKP